MLNFFRRYQRLFFILITVVIVISFSFFGTYSALFNEGARQETAFTAVDGSYISRAELEQMALFIGTDAQDKMLFGGVWGPNFLNDGVVKNDFLETGLASILAQEYIDQLQNDIQAKADKEKRFRLYSHPQAKFLSAENAWNYFAPALKEKYYTFLNGNLSPQDSFDARINLFLAEKQFPAPALRQVLQYQERQYGWLQPDASLNYADLSLFGYHTLNDWFGHHFINLISAYIINAAKIAEQRGYTVSKEEAYVDLMRNAETSFQQNAGSPHMALANAQQYFNEQLRRMSMDQVQALKIWRQVLLFRRLFKEMGNTVLVDPFEYSKLDKYAKETAVGELYHLPKALQLGSFQDLQKFQIYLAAVAPAQQDKLDLPQTFFTLDKMEKEAPELVQRRFLLEVAEVDSKTLQGRVSLKETWNWEADENNWNKLKQMFPELALKEGSTRDERLKSLDSLDDKTRNSIDAYARNAIVDSKPEWITEALAQAKPRELEVGIRIKGANSLFQGADKPETLIQQLDKAPLGTPIDITFDNKKHYRVKVIEKNPKSEILTFAEAKSSGALDSILKEKLEPFYVSIRANRAAEFQNADKTWKPLKEVQEQVANLYFESLLKAIKDDVEKNGTEKEKRNSFNGDFYASHRLYKYVRDVKDKIQKDMDAASKYVTEEKENQALADQWKLEKNNFRFDRSGTGEEKKVNASDVLALTPNSWTEVNVFPNGEMTFIYLKDKVDGSDKGSVAMKMEKVQNLLSDEAQRILMRQTLKDMKITLN